MRVQLCYSREVPSPTKRDVYMIWLFKLDGVGLLFNLCAIQTQLTIDGPIHVPGESSDLPTSRIYLFYFLGGGLEQKIRIGQQW